MSIKERFTKWLNSFENLFMKNHSCISCGREILDGTKFQLCDKCFYGLEKLDVELCEKCGDKVLVGNKICDHCKTFDYHFDENRSYCYYSDASSKIVKRFKYSHKKFYAKHIAELLMQNNNYFKNVDIITFVPINKKRLNERGFNQAEEIAKEISVLTNIEVLNLLEKSNDSKHQAGLKKKDRLENLKGSFSAVHENAEKIKGKVILIVDDVFTTGATLSECSRIIKKLKPKKIKTLTFAKTRFEIEK